MKILVSFGTRPEAIKMCPLVLELKKRKNIIVKVCVTGQHREMLEQVIVVFDVKPDYNLDIMQAGQTLSDVTISILNKFPIILEDFQPDMVLVHGDTTSAFAVGLACFYRKIPIAHVEAGLRTNNIYSPYPEEFNRHALSIIAKWNFAPTQDTLKNLILENVPKESIHVTGNTVIDALKYTVKNDFKDQMLDWVENKKLIILTAHRRENWGKPMREMFEAVKEIAIMHDDIKIIYPVHKNPQVQTIAHEILGLCDNIKLIQPLDVMHFHNILSKCYFVLTDSGGIQEEAAALKKPVLVMRDTTERPEGVEAGILKLVGTNKESIIKECNFLLKDKVEYNRMSNAKNPYGDGTASIRIADIIEREV